MSAERYPGADSSGRDCNGCPTPVRVRRTPLVPPAGDRAVRERAPRHGFDRARRRRRPCSPESPTGTWTPTTMRSSLSESSCASLGDGVAASLQTRPNRTPIGIGPCPPRSCALIELLLGLLRLRLRIGIGGRADDRARGAADDCPGAGIAWTSDDRTDDGAADQSGHGARSGRIGGLNDHTLIRAGIRAARVHSGLLDRPNMAFVAVALRLFRTLTVCGIDEYSLRRRRRNTVGAGRWSHAGGHEYGDRNRDDQPRS